MHKGKGKIPIRIIILFFIIFMGLFIANTSGYYESKIRERVLITEDGIKDFENRVQNGEEIDIMSFMNDEKVDYSSTFSKVGESVTNNLETVITKCMKIISKIVKSLF